MTLVHFFHGLWAHRTLDSIAAAIAEFGIAIPLMAVAAAWLRRRSKLFLLTIAVGGVIAAVLDVLAGHIIHSTRPFVVLGVAPLLAHDADNSFPSDHAVAAAYLATALAFFDPMWAVVAGVGAVAIGLARIYCLLHWPGDVLAGLAIGALAAMLTYAIITRGRQSRST